MQAVQYMMHDAQAWQALFGHNQYMRHTHGDTCTLHCQACQARKRVTKAERQESMCTTRLDANRTQTPHGETVKHVKHASKRRMSLKNEPKECTHARAMDLAYTKDMAERHGAGRDMDTRGGREKTHAHAHTDHVVSAWQKKWKSQYHHSSTKQFAQQ